MPDPAEPLYGLPLEEFVPARDATARELRRAGDREAAARLAKLPKPTPAAWVANQVAREHPDLLEALLAAGSELRDAQAAALAGHGAGALREATAAERAAVEAVMSAAASYRPAGRALSRAMTDRLRTTLHAAAGDEALRAALAAGRLTAEPEAGGAWPFAAAPEGEPRAGAADETARGGEAAAAGGRGAAAGERDAAESERRRREAERERLEAERAAAKAARAALEGELREARGALRVRQRVADSAAADAAHAETRLEAARSELEDARAEAEAAARIRDETRSALQEARDAVARLEERLD